jgi:D-3-phosphoglycerate dehydrogenase
MGFFAPPVNRKNEPDENRNSGQLPFANADVLSLHVRLTLATQRIVGPENLARRSPRPLSSTRRARELTAPSALVAALHKGRPNYAATDVYEEDR